MQSVCMAKLVALMAAKASVFVCLRVCGCTFASMSSASCMHRFQAERGDTSSECCGEVKASVPAVSVSRGVAAMFPRYGIISPPSVSLVTIQRSHVSRRAWILRWFSKVS